jgi:twitching motility protein PilT
MALVEQRELHEDTLSFASALKHVLRQDPDVIMVGEMRDIETFAAAVSAAETGHLVFSTLHTKDVVQTVDRIIDMFPSMQQNQIRAQLSCVLEGVLCQRLIPSDKINGLVLAREVMIANDAVRNLIREGKTQMIPSTMETGAKSGMKTMDHALINLYKQGFISRSPLLFYCNNQEHVKNLID